MNSHDRVDLMAHRRLSIRSVKENTYWTAGPERLSQGIPEVCNV